MKTYSYKNEKVKVIKDLNIKDKNGNWVQVEFTTGNLKGCRYPAVKEELVDF
jgi:hypothetical protein